VATSLHTRPNDYVYYANIAGQGIASSEWPQNWAELRLKTRPASTAATSSRQHHAEPIYESTETNLFDRASAPGSSLPGVGRVIWTPAYIDFNATTWCSRVHAACFQQGQSRGWWPLMFRCSAQRIRQPAASERTWPRLHHRGRRLADRRHRHA
jgi:hypothetical protein